MTLPPPQDALSSIFNAIRNDDGDTLRALLAVDRSLSKLRLAGNWRYPEEAELDCFKFLGAYMGKLTALHYALLQGKEVIAQDIIDHSFDQDLALTFGDKNNALHLAAFFNYPEIARELVKRGLNPLWKNGKGFAPVDLTTEPEVLAALNLEEE